MAHAPSGHGAVLLRRHRGDEIWFGCGRSADGTRSRPRRAPAWCAAMRPLIPLLAGCLLVSRGGAAQTEPHAQAQPRILGDLVDVSEEFEQPDQIHFVASRVTQFDPATGAGTLRWDRYMRQPSYSFNKMDMALVRAASNEFPATEYDRDPALPFEITFVTPRTVRLRFFTRDLPPSSRRDTDSLMLAGPVPVDRSWKVTSGDSIVRYTSAYGEVRLLKHPWAVELYDAAGKLLTRTQTLGDPASFQPYTPFS